MGQNGGMTDATTESVVVASEPATTTTLVHRGARGVQEWWRSCVVYVNDPPLLNGQSTVDDVVDRTELLRPISRLGAEAVRIGCPPADDDAVTAAVEELLARAHRLGLRVIMRIDPADAAAEAAARHWLACGVDGLDLGWVGPGAQDISHTRYRELQTLLAETVDDGILSIRLTPQGPAAVTEILHEDWLHHVVDTALTRARTADEARRAIDEAYSARDVVGAPAAWLVPDLLDTGSLRRARASALLVLALPGAPYLRQGTELGLPAKRTKAETPGRDEVAEAARAEQRGVTGSTFEMFRAALRLRTDFRLGTASLAWVSGLIDPEHPEAIAFLTGEVLVVANVGDTPLRLASESDVLLASGPLGSAPEGGHIVPPETTVWLWMAPPAAEPDARVRH